MTRVTPRKPRHPWRVKAPTLPADVIKALPAFTAPRPRSQGHAMAFLANVADQTSFGGEKRIDWRLGGAVPTPRSQGAFNSCTSFAVVSVVETLHFLQRHTRIRLAPGFIHACLLGLSPQQGANPDEAIDAAAVHGIAYGFPNDYPYPGDHCTTGNLYTISRRVWLPGRNTVLQVLATQGPIVADMFIDPTFIQVGRNQVYRLPQGSDQRLHSVAIVGCDLDAGHWIIANSLGTEWGDDGFGRVAFGSGGLIDERGGWQILL